MPPDEDGACRHNDVANFDLMDVPGIKPLLVGGLMTMGSSTYAHAVRDPHMTSAVAAAAKSTGKDPWVKYYRALAAANALETVLPKEASKELDRMRSSYSLEGDRSTAATAPPIVRRAAPDVAARVPLRKHDIGTQTITDKGTIIAMLMRMAAPPAMPAFLHFQPQHLEALRWLIYVVLAQRPA